MINEGLPKMPKVTIKFAPQLDKGIKCYRIKDKKGDCSLIEHLIVVPKKIKVAPTDCRVHLYTQISFKY